LRKADGGIIAHGCDGFQRHVAGALDGPFVILFEQDRADEPDDRILVWKDADHFGTPLDRMPPTKTALRKWCPWLSV
jgi:hypothetical protein